MAAESSATRIFTLLNPSAAWTHWVRAAGMLRFPPS
jgi:hypothetical protein